MNSFQKVVLEVTEIAEGYCQGLAALGSDSKYVCVKDPKKLDGSVDIDSCTKSLFPEASRWDYIVSYARKAFFLEVHPATGGMVKEMEAKLTWLKQWLKDRAAALDDYPSGAPRFSWVHSGKCGLTKTSSEYRKAAMMGLIPKRRMLLGP